MSTKNTYRLTLYRYKLLSVSYIAVKIVRVRYIMSLMNKIETRKEPPIYKNFQIQCSIIIKL